jgi:YD repeat-containing protein
MTDSVGVTTYVYDDLGRLISVDDPITGTVSYGYDLAGNRTQLTYPTGEVVTYTYRCMGLSRGKHLTNLKIGDRAS